MAISTINQAGLNAPLTLTSPVLTTPNLGTPSALVLTNATGTPAAINLSNATALARAALPSGCVIQVVSTPYSAYTTTTNTSLVATGVTASITPRFATSKILVLVSMNGLHNSTSSGAMHFELYRDGSSQTYLDDINGYNGSMDSGTSYQYFDSPATTSATTYAMYWKSITGTNIQLNNYYTGNNRTVSSMTLMEIAQ